MDRRQFRNLVFRVHTWLGLNLCLLLALIFATGTLLIFSPELNQYQRPHLWITPAPSGTPEATPGEIYDSLMAEDNIARIDMIGGTSRPWFGRTVLASGSGGGVNAQVDVHTAKLIGYGSGSRLRNTIRAIHDTLLFPIVSVAHVVVNLLSFVVLTMVFTGLITYRKFWKGYLRLPARDADRRTRRGAWHRLFGVWVAPFLIASALASSVFFMNAVGWQPVAASVSPIPERAERLPVGFDGAALDALIAECRAQVPEFKDTRLQMPWDNRGALQVFGYDAAVGQIFGGVTCHLDPSGATTPQIVRASDGNAMVNLYSLAVAVHYGIWWGWVSLALWTLGGVGSVMLALTGAQVYASRISRMSGSPVSDASHRGTLAVLISGLGILKWGYAALLLGMCAVVVVKAVM